MAGRVADEVVLSNEERTFLEGQVRRPLHVTAEQGYRFVPRRKIPKSQVQALDREQAVLLSSRQIASQSPAGQWMVPGVADRRTHTYIRHGTTSLFAALDIATLTAWRTDNNTERPHSRLGWQTLAEFAQTFTPQRGLPLRNSQSSAPAPVAQPAEIGKTQALCLAHAG